MADREPDPGGAGYAAAGSAAAMAAVTARAVAVVLSRKRITWDALIDIPVGLSRQDARGPDAGGIRELILGEPGLRYHGPWAGTRQGWLVIVGITNPGPAAVRSGDFSAPLSFAFPGRQVHATRLVPEPPGDRPPRQAPQPPSVIVPPQDRADDSHAGVPGACVQLTGNFLLRPGDSYSLLLILTGTPAGRSPRIHHEGALAVGKIIPPPW
jgi:hypothetical protein